MSDRDELVELMGRYANMPDSGDWDELPKSVFTDPVTLDFESLSGYPAAVYPRAAVMVRFKESFSRWAATHHAVTNHQITIDGDRATVRAHIRAEHWLPKEVAGDGPDCWLVVGFYDDAAVRTRDGWRFTSIKLTVRHQENAHLFSGGGRNS
jgi:hypothetical protein